MENKKRLIDANSILEEFLKRYTEMERDGKLVFAACEIKQDFADMISNAATVDAVEVVRCRDCKHCVDAHDDGFMYCMRPIEAPDYSETGYCYPLEVRVGFYGFCNYGERKDGDGNG